MTLPLAICLNEKTDNLLSIESLRFHALFLPGRVYESLFLHPCGFVSRVYLDAAQFFSNKSIADFIKDMPGKTLLPLSFYLQLSCHSNPANEI
jgi:hypothetical protein